MSAELNSHYSNESDEQDDKEEKNNASVPREFQENVIKYVKLDDLIRKKQEELAELKSQKKPVEEIVKKYMEKLGENVIDITNGKLRLNKSETKRALSQEEMKKAIATKVKSPVDVDQVIEKMDELRPLVVHVNIKRTGQRSTKGKKKAPKPTTDKDKVTSATNDKVKNV